LEVDITDFAALESFVDDHNVNGQNVSSHDVNGYKVDDDEVDNKANGKISDCNIDWIINCSAYTNVDGAEDQEELAFKVNALGVKNLALLAKKMNVRLIHISTDYVFNGRQGDYSEEDQTDPIGVYGKSKLKGEQHIREICDRYFIIRTAWLYGKNGPNFVKTMLRLFKEKEMINVVQDQIGTPTYTKDLAKTILSIIASSSDIEKSSIIDKDNNCYGIYHYTNLGKTSWFYFANEVYQQARLLGLIEKEVKINPISTDKYPTRAVRPQNSYLLKDKIIEKFNLSIPSWQNSLQEFLGEFKNQ